MATALQTVPHLTTADHFVVGGFYRVHRERTHSDNLNAPGMQFEPLAFASGPGGEFGHSLSGHGGSSQGAPTSHSAPMVRPRQRHDGPPCRLPQGDAVRTRRGVTRHSCSDATLAPHALRRVRIAPQRVTQLPAWPTTPCNTPQGRMAPDATPNRFYAYGVIARLALLAAARELNGAQQG